jgi:hypothetical protein
VAPFRISFETAVTNAYQLVNIPIIIQALMAAKKIGGEHKARSLGEPFRFPKYAPNGPENSFSL